MEAAFEAQQKALQKEEEAKNTGRAQGRGGTPQVRGVVLTKVQELLFLSLFHPAVKAGYLLAHCSDP